MMQGRAFRLLQDAAPLTIRDNVYKRLAEAFYNFYYMLTCNPKLFNLAEFRIYEHFHLAVVAEQPGTSLQLAHQRYLEVKAIIEQRNFPSAKRTAYDLTEHRHRFSVWAAARAAQRGLKGGKVDVLRDALEQSGVVAFATGNLDPTERAAFDEVHRAWCRSIVVYLESRDVPATFGRAAKLIAIYLKGMVILAGNAESSHGRVLHPPIDGILLNNMCKAIDVQSAHKTTWRKLRWTALNEDAYYSLIGQLRMHIADGEPFWALERFWTVTDDDE